MRITLFAISAIVVGLAGCGDPIGSPCRFQGSGFSASDNCRYQCLETRNIVCPDGADVRPKVCSGTRQCVPGSCADGQVCYHVADPFNEESYCIPTNVCGTHPPDVLATWSQDSVERAAALRAEYAARKARRTQNTKPAPAADAEH